MMLRNFCLFLLGICLALTVLVIRAGFMYTSLELICCDLICIFGAGIAHYEEM